MTLNDSQSLAGHISSISTLTANSSINVQLPVDTFVSSYGASVARMRNNEEKEQEATNENGRVRKNEENKQEANNEDGLTCEDLGDVRETDNNDATLYGRPMGCTNTMSRDNEQRIARAITEASQQYGVIKNHAKHNNTYVARGVLTKIIQVCKQKNQVAPSTHISSFIVHTRAMRNTPFATFLKQGTPSPMLEVEPYLVQLITQVAKMRIPITVLLWAFNLPTQLLKGPPTFLFVLTDFGNSGSHLKHKFFNT